jgi:hypothetical protein
MMLPDLSKRAIRKPEVIGQIILLHRIFGELVHQRLRQCHVTPRSAPRSTHRVDPLDEVEVVCVSRGHFVAHPLVPLGLASQRRRKRGRYGVVSRTRPEPEAEPDHSQTKMVGCDTITELKGNAGERAHGQPC